MKEADLKAHVAAHVDTVEQHCSEVEGRGAFSVTAFVDDAKFEELCQSIGSLKPRVQRQQQQQPQMRQRIMGQLSLKERSPAPRKRTTTSECLSTHNADKDDLSLKEFLYESSAEGASPLSSPKVKYTEEIVQPVFEIGPRNIGGAYYRTVSKEVLPCGVCSGRNNTIIVADIRSSSITILTNTGKCLEVVGTEGRGDGQFIEPTAVFTDNEGFILVADKGLHKVQKFAASGESACTGLYCLSRAVFYWEHNNYGE